MSTSAYFFLQTFLLKVQLIREKQAAKRYKEVFTLVGRRATRITMWLRLCEMQPLIGDRLLQNNEGTIFKFIIHTCE
jgi:hypothetical protein